MMTEELKEKVLSELFPYAVQAVYNAYKTINFELTGKWWQMPDNTLLATKRDCSIVLGILKYCGLTAPYSMTEGSLIHIDTKDIEKCKEMFTWEHVQAEEVIEKRAQELCNIIVKQKMKEYKEQFNRRNLFGKTNTLFQQKLINVRNKIKTHYEEKLHEEVNMHIQQKLINVRNQIKAHYEERLQEEMQEYKSQIEKYKSEISNLKEEIETGYKNQEIIFTQMREKNTLIKQLESTFYNFSSLYEELIPNAKILKKVKNLFKKIQNMFEVLKSADAG